MKRFLVLGFSLLVPVACSPASEADPGGSGGTGGGASNCPKVAEDLISDFKMDNSIAATPDGRQGGWYVYGDSKGTFSPPLVSGAAYPIDSAVGNTNCSGAGSLHTKATGFAEWGAALGTDFKPRASSTDLKPTYDATKYRGVAFWAKGSAPISHVSVKFPDFYQDKEAQPDGVGCIYTAGSQYNCSPYLVQFGVSTLFPNYANAVIDTTWRRFEVLFADTKQDPGNAGWTIPPGDKLAVSQLTGMAIQVNADYSSGSAKANDFEIWIDDVEFIK